MKLIEFYYLHEVSEWLWSSLNDYEEEPNDGYVQQISKKQAHKIMKELGMKRIPFQGFEFNTKNNECDATESDIY